MRRARESGQELTKKTKLIYTPFLDMPPAEGNTGTAHNFSDRPKVYYIHL